MDKHDQTKVGGVFTIEHVRNGEVIDRWEEHNLVTDQGLTHILNGIFKSGTIYTTWYVGLFKGNYTPVAGDTAASFPTSAQEFTVYTEANRQTYTTGTVAANSLTNSASKATFTIGAVSVSENIYGAFITSAQAKSATTGVLMAAAKFTTARTVVQDDQLLITYTFTSSSV